MNTLLSFLQNDYRNAIELGQPLTHLAHVSDEMLGELDAQTALECATWIMGQHWHIENSYYDCISLMYSPALKLLDNIAEAGFTDSLCAAHSPQLSATNQVILAHALQVARNVYPVDDAKVRRVMLLALEYGDCEWIKKNFHVWINDPIVASCALHQLRIHENSIEQALMDIGDVLHANLVRPWDDFAEKNMHWVSSLLPHPSFHSLLEYMSDALKDTHNNPELHQRCTHHVKYMLSSLSLENAHAYLEGAQLEDAQRLLPLLPERFKFELAHHKIFDGNATAQWIRENGTVYEAVKSNSAPVSTKKM